MKLDMRKKQEKKETTKVTKKLPMTAKMKRAMAVYMAMVLIMTAGASTVFAADDPLTVINNLSTFIFGLIRAIGMILLFLSSPASFAYLTSFFNSLLYIFLEFTHISG